MRLSTRGRYGIRALLDLAIRSGQGPVQLKEIAASQDVSLQYLEHLMKPLITAGLVRSMRGARGGIWLARSPSEIKIGEIIGALVGSVAPVECVDDPSICKRARYCVTHDIWCDVKKAIDGVLNSTTLEDLVIRQEAKEQNNESMYYI
jgi:Rrf2 family cysteine metabolism transcriptional repressor